jgi:hypothetical protein
LRYYFRKLHTLFSLLERPVLALRLPHSHRHRKSQDLYP